MFNTTFKLREHKGYCTPLGPNFRKAKAVELNIDNTQIQLKLPRHNPAQSTFDVLRLKSPYQLKNMIFRSYPDHAVLDDSWEDFDFLTRSWVFNGDWFTGILSKMSLYMGLIKKTHPNPEVSFFHPRAFEHAIGDFLTHQFSTHEINGIHNWVTPHNWTVVTSLPCVAAYLEVTPREGMRNNDTKRYLFFPVHNEYIVMLRFSPTRFLNKSDEEMDKLVNAQPMNDLMWKVINSIQIEFSPEVKKQQAEALKGLDDIALTERFSPLKWGTTLK